MKTDRIVLCTILWFLMAFPLIANTDLDLLTSMQGEFDGSLFGWKLASLDFNGDGYKDLVVCSSLWNSEGVYNTSNAQRKFYFYWGGPDFDNIADYTISGSYHNEYYIPTLCFNAGDINGDGCEDLVTSKSENAIAIFYGSPNPTNPPTPPYLYLINALTQGDRLEAYPLGDVNGDGHADLGIRSAQHNYVKLYIWTGISNPWHRIAYTVHNVGAGRVNGVGDVNHDGVDDFVSERYETGAENYHQRLVLYFGNQNLTQVDSLVISENTNSLGGTGACPLGDVNNDGIGDFVAYDNRVWYGGDNLNSTPNLSLNYHTDWHPWTNLVKSKYPYLIHGDLNGDGYDDVIGSNPNQGWYNGEVGIWLGGENMDGNCDMYLNPPNQYNMCQYGWDKAAGDFNGDGLCDLAVSEPNDYATPQWSAGTVYVYSGSTEFVANADLHAPEIDESWQINVYPNPHFLGKDIHIDFAGEGYKRLQRIDINIYNLKGQKIAGLAEINPDATYQIPAGIMSKMGTGIYLLSVQQGGKPVYTKKICMF